MPLPTTNNTKVLLSTIDTLPLPSFVRIHSMTLKKNSITIMKHSYVTTESNKNKLHEVCKIFGNVSRGTKPHKCLYVLTIRGDEEQDADESEDFNRNQHIVQTFTLFTYEKSVVDLLKGQV